MKSVCVIALLLVGLSMALTESEQAKDKLAMNL